MKNLLVFTLAFPFVACVPGGLGGGSDNDLSLCSTDCGENLNGAQGGGGSGALSAEVKALERELDTLEVEAASAAVKNFTQLRSELAGRTGVAISDPDISGKENNEEVLEGGAYQQVKTQLPIDYNMKSYSAFSQVGTVKLSFSFCLLAIEEAKDEGQNFGNLNEAQLADFVIESFQDHEALSADDLAHQREVLVESFRTDEEVGDLVAGSGQDKKERLATVGCTILSSSAYATLF